MPVSLRSPVEEATSIESDDYFLLETVRISRRYSISDKLEIENDLKRKLDPSRSHFPQPL
ncbi:hypothetical protein EA473_20970 [Natrarchaeobius chitinivorans]|uniref:Uncharacterized protein n=1 Tax=Natrarchaeobius chitinivorans TaxID=1679083 RepID=A0A3N6P4W4_NATCH|nr:hypothetical protein EA473_20970 [Natrarchaeobius chitinivorans]